MVSPRWSLYEWNLIGAIVRMVIVSSESGAKWLRENWVVKC
jgi:hypothetical protein